MKNGKGLSAAVLKNIALITMLIDHATAFLLKAYLNSQGIFSLYSSDLYTFGRIVGRIAFVLYAFMIAEGAVKTRDKVKYALRLLILAAISIVPHSFANANKWFNSADLNIFFLLFTGLIAIYAFQWIEEHLKNKWLSILARLGIAAAASALAVVGKFEYGLMGILLILAFYVFRNDFPKMALWVCIVMTLGYMLNTIVKNGGLAWFTRYSDDILGALWRADRIQIYGILALPLIYFYNGTKGKQLPKTFYYLFYPVHLAIFGLIIHL